MKSSGGKSGQTDNQVSDYSGWVGLHYIVGFVFRLRGVNIEDEALRQAAAATHPMVEGKLPTFLNVLGTYGGVLAGIVGDENDETRRRMEDRDNELGPSAGHRDRPEKQDPEDRPQSVGVDDSISGVDGDSGNVQVDGRDLEW